MVMMMMHDTTGVMLAVIQHILVYRWIEVCNDAT